jgi:hypothetical protein
MESCLEVDTCCDNVMDNELVRCAKKYGRGKAHLNTSRHESCNILLLFPTFL